MAWENIIYLAKFIDTIVDDNGIERRVYEKPQKMEINHQPQTSLLAYKEYGSQVNATRRAYPKLTTHGGKINVKDKVYLIDGENIGIDLYSLVENEEYNGQNANYEVVGVLPSRFNMRVDFKKII